MQDRTTLREAVKAVSYLRTLPLNVEDPLLVLHIEVALVAVCIQR